LRARHFGFVFQDFNLLGALSAQENVELACNLAGVAGAQARARARELLDRFGLGARLRFVPAKLSGGEQQRVAIARALANLLRTLAHEEGRSVLMVSHDARLEEVADRVLWLEDGTFKDLARMTTDPVCGMAVAENEGPHYHLDGVTWRFCSPQCREEFVASPARFVVRATRR
jgi:putative ABC transport system ATP-binding protein